MFHVITGGSGSGKSEYAETMITEYAACAGNLYYVATMMPYDEETKEKIKRHRQMRLGKGFQTIECYRNLRSGMEKGFCGAKNCEMSVLLECMSNLVANELFAGENPLANVADPIMEGIEFLRKKCANLVVVTNEVFSECAQDSPEMAQYKAVLGEINRRMAQAADQVTEVVYGIPVRADLAGRRNNYDTAVREKIQGKIVEKKRQEAAGMRMVIGGAYQGKLDYAKKLYPGVHWIDGRNCKGQEVYICEGIYHLEAYIRRMLQGEFDRTDGEEGEKFCRELVEKNPRLCMITDELGYGLVPVDAFDRRYREETGRICTRLAAASERVDRVVCGIGTVLKGGEQADEDRA